MLRRFQAASLGAAAAGLLALIPPPSAHAQNPCGAHYTVQPGDTLYEIAQQCRIGIDTIMQANPRIESPHRIGAGWRLDLDASDSIERGDSTYVVRRGDTLSAIAAHEGVTLRTLLEANPGVQPRRLAIGQVLTVPVDHPMLQAHLTPRSGRPGDTVRVEGEGFRPHTTVRIGAGPPESEWRMLEDVRVAQDGRVDARVEVPEWAANQDQLIFVVAGERGRQARARFQVVSQSEQMRRVDVRGRVSQGVECPILTTGDGRVYSLGGGGAIDVRTGVYAHVEGLEADVSYCQQWTPIDVGLFRVIEPREEARLPRGYVLGAWSARGGDCRRPDFVIEGNAAGGQVVEASLQGEARTGYVRLGDEPALIFDRPRREMPLEQRRAGSMAVMPPESGPVSLGGVRIEGDGVVFVRCSQS